MRTKMCFLRLQFSIVTSLAGEKQTRSPFDQNTIGQRTPQPYMRWSLPRPSPTAIHNKGDIRAIEAHDGNRLQSRHPQHNLELRLWVGSGRSPSLALPVPIPLSSGQGKVARNYFNIPTGQSQLISAKLVAAIGKMVDRRPTLRRLVSLSQKLGFKVQWNGKPG